MNTVNVQIPAVVPSIAMGLTLLLLAGVAPAQAEQLALLESQDTWQHNVLFEPTPTQLKREDKGSIMIYDGLTDVTVAKALDKQFDRIENMMFTRVIRTGESGAPLRDEAGEVMVEDDGC